MFRYRPLSLFLIAVLLVSLQHSYVLQFIYSANFYHLNDRILLFMAPAHLRPTLHFNVLPSILMHPPPPPCTLCTLMCPPCTRMYHPALPGILLYSPLWDHYTRYTPLLYLYIPLLVDTHRQLMILIINCLCKFVS